MILNSNASEDLENKVLYSTLIYLEKSECVHVKDSIYGFSKCVDCICFVF